MRSVIDEALDVIRGIASPVMSEVARRENVTVAIVVIPTPAGSIVDVAFWNPATSAFQATPPTVQRNQTIGLAVYFKNTTAYSQKMQVKLEVLDPLGIAATPMLGDLLTVNPGDTVVDGSTKLRWVAIMSGTYKANIILTAEVI